MSVSAPKGSVSAPKAHWECFYSPLGQSSAAVRRQSEL